MYLIELLGFFTCLGLLKLWHLLHPRLLTGFGILIFFRNLTLIEVQVRYLGLFLLFPVIDDSGWFWMGILDKNIQLMLEFLKGLYLVVHFPNGTLMMILMILSVILLCMLMVLLSILSVIRHQICGNNWNWLLNLSLIYETPWTGREKGFLISVLEKLTKFRLTGLITLLPLISK